MRNEPGICAFCGCLCDDIEVTIEEDTIVQAKNACALGKAWFLDHGKPHNLPPARINGHPATLEEGIEAAARILSDSRYPIIYGLSSTSCEAQRKAIELAETLGGCIDCCTSVCHGPSGLSMQTVGEPTCSLGEVKNRADLVIYWGSNPAESHPRHMARYAVAPKGMLIPNGRKDRTVIMVDVRPTLSSKAADISLIIPPGKDFEILWTLMALVQDRKVNEKTANELCIPFEQITELVGRMKSCRFGILFYGQGLTQSSGKHMNAAAASLLVRELNRVTKFALLPMRGHGNVTGMDNVMTWQTGYPFAVNYSRGYPRFNPGEFTMVDILSRGEADAILAVASDPMSNLPRSAVKRASEVPLIAIDTHESETTRVAGVSFIAATAGIGAGGTAYRMDSVPLYLKQLLSSPYSSDEEILNRLHARVKELKG